MSNHKNSTANLSDVELRDQGNRLFSRKRFDDAIGCYTNAIRWQQTCQDCRRALDMDQSLVKGHFYLGQSLFELENYDEAITHLQRANDLAKEQKRNFGDDIAWPLRVALEKRRSIQEEKRIRQNIELQTDQNDDIFFEATSTDVIENKDVCEA